MRSQKRYTNATWTRRVDYDGGAHRTARAPSEPRVCTQCGAVYVKRRWVAGDHPGTVGLARVARAVTCPACRRVADGAWRGMLRLEGTFLRDHADQIVHLIENEARRAASDNPLGRIITWDRSEPGVLAITTTTEHLAKRLGSAVARACGGTVEYGFSHGNKVARIHWRRDDEKAER